MADRDTPGTGGPNQKASDPMARNPSNGSSSTTGQSNTMGSSGKTGTSNNGDRMTSFDRNTSSDRDSGDLSRMADDATEAGRDTVNSAQGRIRSLLEQQSHRAADQLGSVANALHKAAEQLSDENNGTAARYAGQAAERVEQVADILRNSTVDDMVGQVERFARRQPEVFVGAAFAVGFLAARFIKSSGNRGYQGGGYQGQARFQNRSAHLTGRQDSDHQHHDYRDFGQASYGSSSARNAGGAAGVASSLHRDTDRGMAGGIAGSAGAPSLGASAGTSGAARQGNYATAGAAPPRASLNSATAATAAARTRDAAHLMAGGTSGTEGTGSSDIASAKPNQGKTGVGADLTPASTTPVTGVKPQGHLP